MGEAIPPNALDPVPQQRVEEQPQNDFSDDSDSDSKQSSDLLSFKHYHFKDNTLYNTESLPDVLTDGFFRSFPNNVFFKQEDFLHDTHYGDVYDTITWYCPFPAITSSFSVTKWVQLNWGDDGLLYLLLKAYSLLKPHGLLIIEYQSWSSYHKKRAYCDAIARVFPTLQIRPEHIPTILQRIGMQLLSNRKPISNMNIPPHITKGFNRNIAVLRKTGEELPLDFREVTVENLRERFDVGRLVEGLSGEGEKSEGEVEKNEGESEKNEGESEKRDGESEKNEGNSDENDSES